MHNIAQVSGLKCKVCIKSQVSGTQVKGPDTLIIIYVIHIYIIYMHMYDQRNVKPARVMFLALLRCIASALRCSEFVNLVDDGN